MGLETAQAQEGTAEAAAGAQVDVAPAVRALGQALERQRLCAGQAAFGAGPTELSALEWLFLEERTPTDLAQRLQLTTASVTGLVDRLAAQQLVDRRPHPRDRRKILVALTDEARTRLADVFARFAALTTRALDHLEPAGRRQLVDSLERITAELHAEVGPAPGRPEVGPDPAGDDRLAQALQRIGAATTAFARPGEPAGPARGAPVLGRPGGQR